MSIEKQGTTTQIAGNDTDLTVRSDYTWGYINGFVNQTTPSNSLRGEFSDWRFARGATEAALALPASGGTGQAIAVPADAATFLSAPAWNSASPIWLAFPVAAAGYRTFYASLTSSLNVDLNISAWFMPEIDNGLLGINLSTAGGPLFAAPIIADEILSVVVPLPFGPGGKDLTLFSSCPQGYVVVRLKKTSATPTAGNVRVGISRQQ